MFYKQDLEKNDRPLIAKVLRESAEQLKDVAKGRTLDWFRRTPVLLARKLAKRLEAMADKVYGSAKPDDDDIYMLYGDLEPLPAPQVIESDYGNGSKAFVAPTAVDVRVYAVTKFIRQAKVNDRDALIFEMDGFNGGAYSLRDLDAMIAVLVTAKIYVEHELQPANPHATRPE